MPAALRAVRGATTVDEDTADQVRTRTQALIGSMLKENGIAVDDLVSIMFTMTNDIVSMFPATAARELGLDDVALLGATESDVVGGLPRCIRVLIHFYSDRLKSELHHLYLEEAKSLRSDLAT